MSITEWCCKVNLVVSAARLLMSTAMQCAAMLRLLKRRATEQMTYPLPLPISTHLEENTHIFSYMRQIQRSKLCELVLEARLTCEVCFHSIWCWPLQEHPRVQSYPAHSKQGMMSVGQKIKGTKTDNWVIPHIRWFVDLAVRLSQNNLCNCCHDWSAVTCHSKLSCMFSSAWQTTEQTI